MSLFLTPIHTWLFNKIVILEEIEKAIEEQFNDDGIQAFATDLKSTMGDYIPDLPLEAMIDTDNIHGWLQNRITTAETRQAALVRHILTKNEAADEVIQSIYKAKGVQVAMNFADKTGDSTQLYNALNDCLLEGMPCDRVNSIRSKSPDEIVWITTNCVHKNNWEGSGVDVEFYYGYRAAFISGFVEAANSNFSYQYCNDGEQVHRIYKIV